jgi:hypothetical protein
VFGEQFSVDGLSIFEGKKPVELDFTATLDDGREYPTSVRLFQAEERGRDCFISVTDSEIIHVRSCVDIEKGTPVYTRIEEKGYEQAEVLISYNEDEVRVEYTEDGETRTDTLENDRTLDGYILTLLFSVLPYEEMAGEKREFSFLDYRKPSLVDVTLTFEGMRKGYDVGDRRVGAVEYETRANNFVVRMFTKPSHFYYGTREDVPVMLEYEGVDPSSIRKRISFELSPDAYRDAREIFEAEN